MSSSAWQPPLETRAGLMAPRVARIAGAEFEAAAQPIAWREIGAAGSRAVPHASQPPADAAGNTESLRREYEQRVAEARAAGAREAEASAKTRAAAEVQSVLAKLGESIADLARMRPRLRKQAEIDCIKLSLAIARRIIRREIALDPDAMRGLVMAALEKLQTQEIHRVRVSASHASALAAILRQTTPQANIEVVPDGSLAPGGVVFETNQGNLDASVDSQLQEIERGLADRLRSQS